MLHALLLATTLTVAEKDVVSVLYFDNATGNAEYDVLRKGLADMVITDLVAWSGVSVVERDKLESVLGEIKLQRSASFDSATAVRVGKLVGAKYLLKGTITLPDSQLMLDAQLVDVARGTVTTTARARGPRDDVFSLEQKLVDDLTRNLSLTANKNERNRARVPSFDTLMQYSRALDLADQGNPAQAEAALKQLVSKNPLFSLARERREAILKRLKESENTQATTTTLAVNEMQRLIDAELGKGAPATSEAERQRLVTVLTLKGLLIVRQLIAHVSTHDPQGHVVLPGHEKEARALMQAWADNQQEIGRAKQSLPHFIGNQTVSGPLGAALRRSALTGVGSDSVPVTVDADIDLLEFLVDGRVRTGSAIEQFAPPLGRQVPTLVPPVMARMNERVAALVGRATTADQNAVALQNEAAWLLQSRGVALEHLGDDEGAAREYQRIFDETPQSFRVDQAKKAIETIAGIQRSSERDDQANWREGLTTCGQRGLLSASRVIGAAMHREGFVGIEALAAAVEKACPVRNENVNAIASLYNSLGSISALNGDCPRAQRFWLKYAQLDGLNRGLSGTRVRIEEGCGPPEAATQLVWVRAKLDGAPFELTEYTVSQRTQQMFGFNSHDGEGALYVHWSVVDGVPRSVDGCALRLAGGDQFDGTCTGTVTTLAASVNGIDEGTFSGTFENPKTHQRYTLTEGVFHARRN